MKRAPAEADAPWHCAKAQASKSYIFFSVHFLAAASHTPPALSQLALSVAFVTSPAKAGPVKASAIAMANIEIRVFMDVSPLRCTRQELGNANLQASVPTPLRVALTFRGGMGLPMTSAALTNASARIRILQVGWGVGRQCGRELID